MLSRARGFFLLLFAFLAFLSHTALAATVPAGACLYALDATASDAFQIAGAQSVYTACGVVSESSSSSAFEMEGSETLYLEDHAQVSVVGGAQLNGQKLWDTINNAQAQPVQVTSPGDPFASLTAPTSGTIVSSSHASYDMNNKPHNNTLSPGVYCGGLTIGNTNGATFTFSPGLYVMAGGGLTLNSQALVAGTGVTFYITSSTGWGCSGSSSYTPLTISGQVTANFSAPTSGTYDGILFFGNRTGCSTAGSCQDQINGGSSTILNGALYFKSDQIEITGSNASGYTMLVADKIYINGNSTFATDGSPFDGITVSVSPSSAALNPNQTQQFTATVTNSSNPAVTVAFSLRWHDQLLRPLYRPIHDHNSANGHRHRDQPGRHREVWISDHNTLSSGFRRRCSRKRDALSGTDTATHRGSCKQPEHRGGMVDLSCAWEH